MLVITELCESLSAGNKTVAKSFDRIFGSTLALTELLNVSINATDTQSCLLFDQTDLLATKLDDATTLFLYAAICLCDIVGCAKHISTSDLELGCKFLCRPRLFGETGRAART